MSTARTLDSCLRQGIGMVLAACCCVLAQPPASVPAPPALAPVVAVPAGRAASNVAIVPIRGPIDRYTALSVQRRFADAAKAGADAIVIELDTPGGEMNAVLDICTTVKTAPLKNVVAWVHHTAYSGGAIIALACREVVISDVATLGDAAPIAVIAGLGGKPKLGETERAKALAPLLAELVDSARTRGYDEKLVQGLVSLGVELWLVERADQPGQRLFIDRAEYRLLFGTEPTGSSPRLVGPRPEPVSASPTASAAPPPAATAPEAATSPAAPRAATDFVPALPGLGATTSKRVSDALTVPATRPVLTEADRGKWTLVEHVSDGSGIFTFKRDDLWRYRLAVAAPASASASGAINTDDELRAFFGATSMGRLEQSGWEHAAAFMAHPIVRGLLIVILLVGLFIEITHPGMVLPGSVALLAALALFAPPILMGLAAWWTAAALVAGVCLLVLEVVVLPGFGVFGVLGLVLLFGGLVGSFLPTASQGLFPNSPAARSDLLYGLTTVGVSTAVSIVAMYFVGKHLGSLPIVGKLILTQRPPDDEAGASLLGAMGPADSPARVGDAGIALTPLRPSGRMRIGERHLDVVAEGGYIAAGAQVRVCSVDDFRVVVEAAPDAAPPRVPPGPQGATA